MRSRKRNRFAINLILMTALLVIVALYAIPFKNNKAVEIMGNLVVTSKAFNSGGDIPEIFTRKGEDRSPPLEIKGIDPLAKTIAIIVDDPDIPIPFLSFTHWVVYNIPVEITEIHENVPHEEVISLMGGAMQGKNGFRRTGYMGPNPPFGTHTYRFIIYTLDVILDLKPGADRKQLEKAMDGHILQIGVLEGRYGS